MACILLVEDESLIRGILTECLTDAGYEVLEAARADDALLLLEVAENVRLIVTDINMPGGQDGIDLAKAAREHSPTIPIVFISGRPAKLDEARVIGGPAAFIAKPFKLSQVLADVRRLVEA